MLVAILFDYVEYCFISTGCKLYRRLQHLYLLIKLPVFIGMVHYRDGMLWGWLSPLRSEMFNSLVPSFQHQRGGDRIGRHKGAWKEKEVDSNLKEEVNMVEVDLNLMEVLLSCSFSFLRGKYEI